MPVPGTEGGMPVLVSLLGATVAALTVVLAAEWAGRGRVVGDTEGSERWLVAHIARVPVLSQLVAALGRFVWGGTMVATGLVILILGGGFVGWVFSTIDDDRGFARLDESAAEWGSDRATELSTVVLRGVTYLGETWVLLAVVTIVGLAAIARFPGRRWAVLAFLWTVVLGVSLVNNALKWMVERERPMVDHLAGSGGSSFPSGHTAAAAAAWTAIAIVVSRRMPARGRRWAMAVAVAVGVMVAASRVMLGVHWLTDVVAGLVVGWTLTFLVALAFGGRIQRFGEPAERVEAAEDAVQGSDDPARTPGDSPHDVETGDIPDLEIPVQNIATHGIDEGARS